LEKCTEEQQNVFVRRYLYFYSVSEIAKTYGFSQSKVKTMLFRMRSDLKKHLEEGGYDV
jgi:RNA polymerase sigma-70 factor (ECF subfamily)